MSTGGPCLLVFEGDRAMARSNARSVAVGVVMGLLWLCLVGVILAFPRSFPLDLLESR